MESRTFASPESCKSSGPTFFSLNLTSTAVPSKGINDSGAALDFAVDSKVMIAASSNVGDYIYIRTGFNIDRDSLTDRSALRTRTRAVFWSDGLLRLDGLSMRSSRTAIDPRSGVHRREVANSVEDFKHTA